MDLTPVRLLRLFPGLWRLRYGAEFLALLESAPVTRTIMVDVVRSAAQEWVTRTRIGRLLIGLAVSIVGALCATTLTRVVPPQTLISDLARPWSFASVAMLALVGAGTWFIGWLLIVAKTRRDRRYDWMGLRQQVIVLLVSTVCVDWALLVVYPSALLYLGGTMPVTLVLIDLLNVERRREGFWPWPPPWWMRVASDRY